MLEEYKKTGHVKHCPVCGGGELTVYGSSFDFFGDKLAIICPKCGVIGHYSTVEED